MLPRGRPGPCLLFLFPLCFFSRGPSAASLPHFCGRCSPGDGSHVREFGLGSVEKRIMDPKLEKVSSGGDVGVGLEGPPLSSSSLSSSSSSSSSCSSSLGKVIRSGGEDALPDGRDPPVPADPLPPVLRPLWLDGFFAFTSDLMTSGLSVLVSCFSAGTGSREGTVKWPGESRCLRCFTRSLSL